MKNDNKKRPFVIVYLDLIEQGLTYEEAALLSYVQRFTKNGAPCFAAIPYIATELKLSERTVRRCLKTLLDRSFLTAEKRGRGRILRLPTPAKTATDPGQIVTNCGQIGRSDCGQIGRLSNRSMINKITSRSNNNINNNNNNNNIINSKSNKSDLDYAEFKRRLLAGRHKTSTGNLDDLPD